MRDVERERDVMVEVDERHHSVEGTFDCTPVGTAVLGDELTVPCIDGKVKYNMPEGTQSGTIFRLRGKGVQKLNRNERGDQYVRVVVEVPRGLNKTQKDLLRKYEESLGESNYRNRKNFFDKIKDILKN